jgi:hypothetical protein
MIKGKDSLRSILNRIDGRGYKAYKDIAGHYKFENFTLYIDYVQGDPFAAPSRIRIRLPHKIAALPRIYIITIYGKRPWKIILPGKYTDR